MSVLHGSLDATHLVLLYIGAALAGAGGGFAEAAIFAEGSPAATHLPGVSVEAGWLSSLLWGLKWCVRAILVTVQLPILFSSLNYDLHGVVRIPLHLWTADRRQRALRQPRSTNPGLSPNTMSMVVTDHVVELSARSSVASLRGRRVSLVSVPEPPESETITDKEAAPKDRVRCCCI